MFAQFVNVGAQVGIWSNLIPYFKAYTAMGEKSAGYMVAVSLVALALGRFITTPLMRFLSPAKLTGIYGVVNIGLVLVGITHPGLTGGYALMATSFFMSIMFPTIFALGIKGLGPHTKLGGSFLVMAIVGGALFPLIMGAIKDATGQLSIGFWFPMMSYAVIALYGLLGGQSTSVSDVKMSPEAL